MENETIDVEIKNDPMIVISNLTKNYPNKQVINDLSLTVYKGELFGFIGRNGAGKSTTIECMIGVRPFDKGTIVIGGYDLKREPIEVKKILGYTSSEPVTYDEMSGFHYLEFISSIYKMRTDTFINNFNYLTKRLEFSNEDLNRPIKEYSHGMQQKICLIASLINNPKLWVLDEPTVGLDPFTTNELTKMMREYVEHGNTCFIASHNIDLVSKLCDRVAIINQGKIIKIFDLKNNQRDRYELAPYFFQHCEAKEVW